MEALKELVFLEIFIKNFFYNATTIDTFMSDIYTISIKEKIPLHFYF